MAFDWHVRIGLEREVDKVIIKIKRELVKKSHQKHLEEGGLMYDKKALSTFNLLVEHAREVSLALHPE